MEEYFNHKYISELKNFVINQKDLIITLLNGNFLYKNRNVAHRRGDEPGKHR